jgi:hypothetical protein
MNEERFRSLAAAYGGAISRWPIADRAAARWFACSHLGLSRDVLRDAQRLDRVLRRSAKPHLGPQFRRALFEDARGPRVEAVERRSWFGAILGAGLATACAAGIGAGFAIAPLTTDTLASPADPAEVAAAALGNPTELGDG